MASSRFTILIKTVSPRFHAFFCSVEILGIICETMPPCYANQRVSKPTVVMQD